MLQGLEMIFKETYPEKDNVLVCVDSDQYVNSFSRQWDLHRSTQVDSRGFVSGYPQEKNSHFNFYRKTMLTPEQIRGKVVMDAGCGVGRYAEAIAKEAELVICVDLSEAVFHCAELLRSQGFDNSLFMQADLSCLGLMDNSVDVIASIGVIHHAENPLAVIKELYRILKPGGIFAGWVYEKQASYDMVERKTMRDFTTNPDNFGWVEQFAKLAPALRDLRAKNERFDPIDQVLGISSSRNDQESILDTIDWLTPKYQYQYTYDEFRRLLVQAGFNNITMGDVPVNFKAIK